MNEDHWKQWISEQTASGLSKVAFCRERNLKPSTFHYWSKRLNGDGINPTRRHGRPRKFARVEVVGATSSSAGEIQIRFPMGLEIRAEKYPEPKWMAEIMSVLGGRG